MLSHSTGTLGNDRVEWAFPFVRKSTASTRTPILWRFRKCRNGTQQACATSSPARCNAGLPLPAPRVTGTNSALYQKHFGLW
ncbi:hypothetical protein PBRA_004839 [Plasmodiophora brassicae]|uniref:Uncharacterized protein n=1 Tax=Plasmodiophora brassicae TaxID=37360 RepID=A0A0G4ILX5_PLABS|nr:hypothetical protein PBRA_004839 [Plasmodiophora brassicae]